MKLLSLLEFVCDIVCDNNVRICRELIDGYCMASGKSDRCCSMDDDDAWEVGGCLVRC